jgi:hypothetical protein
MLLGNTFKNMGKFCFILVTNKLEGMRMAKILLCVA